MKENKLGLGMVPIGAVDKNGRELHQYQAVICQGINSLIMWSMFFEDFTGMTNDGMYLQRDEMKNAEYVLFNEEDQWDQLEDVISRMPSSDAEIVVRLITSHYNMEGMMNEAAAALAKISEETTDEATKGFATEKLTFLRSLIPKSDGQV